jgi:DNA polymerase-3 subunit delta'
MSFKSFPQQQQGIELLQRSLRRGRLGHAYLFTGHDLGDLETLARTLAKTLNCLEPVRQEGAAVDCCDHCLSCRKIEHGNHADVHWVRPESKSRIISVDLMRELMREIQLKPAEAEYKVAVVVAADRMKTEGANAFLKTLEEPPPKSILILLTTESPRLLDTIISRCLRRNFAGDAARPLPAEQRDWLAAFSQMAATGQKSLFGRYLLLDVLLEKLTTIKEAIDKTLTDRSPLNRYPDAEKETQERWEDELKAAIEAEYRRQRADLLLVLQRWLRDVWVAALGEHPDVRRGQGAPDALPGLLNFPDVPATPEVARRISPVQATENLKIVEQLQRWLGSNVQEALALEVSLLKLHL